MDEQFERESSRADAALPSESVIPDDLSSLPAFLHESDAGDRTTRPSRGRESGTAGRNLSVPASQNAGTEAPDAGSIPFATISPRRLLHVVAVVALAWGVISFGRQVATASAASSHADELRRATSVLQDQVGAMQAELALIQEQRYVDLQARAFRLGHPNEVPFALEPNAPALGPDAPGSASTRLGAVSTPASPLDRWLDILFGAHP